jgi:hypothetical protein
VPPLRVAYSFPALEYVIPVLYIITDRIIALYIYLIRAKIIFHVNAVILISAIIYRSILPSIALIYIPYFSFEFSQIFKILISIFDIIRIFGNIKYAYFIRASRLRFREKWISSYLLGANFILFFLFIKCSGRESSLNADN